MMRIRANEEAKKASQKNNEIKQIEILIEINQLIPFALIRFIRVRLFSYFASFCVFRG